MIRTIEIKDETELMEKYKDWKIEFTVFVKDPFTGKIMTDEDGDLYEDEEFSFTGKINDEFSKHLYKYGLDYDFILNDSLGCIEYQKEKKISINLIK